MIDNLTVYELFHNTNFFGVCETAADVVAKEVQISDFQLDVGVSVMIKFKYSNSATSPTLNISGSGAIPICLVNPSEISVSWEEWDVIPFTYDGTYWQMTSNPGVKVTQIPTDTTNSDFEVLFSGTADNDEHIEEARKSKYLKFNPSEKTLYVNDGYESQGTETVTNLFEDTSLVSYSMTADVGWYNNYNAFWFRGIQSKTLLKYNPSISNNVIEIRYKIECINPPAEQTDYTKVCIGIKSTSQDIAYVSSTDTDFIAKNIHQFEEQNQVIEDVLRVNASSDYYLYVIANNQSMFLEKLETVQYEGLLINRSYLTNNELGVIKTSNNVTTSLKVKDDDIVLSGTDNTWDGTNISLKDTVSALGDIFVSPTTSVAGKKGMVPAPAVIEHIDNKLFLRSDGTWDFEGVYRETQYTDVGAPQNFYCDGNGDIVIVNNWTPQRKIDEASDGKNGIYYNTYFNDNYQIQRGIPQDEYEISLGSRGIYLEINTFDDYTKKKNNIPVSENTSSMDISAGDIVVSTTWDGTNDSLKDAIGSAKGTVLQTETTAGDYEFEMLFSDTTGSSTITSGVRKSSDIIFNPNYNSLTVKQDNYTAVQMRPHNNRSQLSVYGGTSSTHYSISIEADTSGADITNSATWDGTHASLKSTITAILARLN